MKWLQWSTAPRDGSEIRVGLSDAHCVLARLHPDGFCEYLDTLPPDWDFEAELMWSPAQVH